MTRRNGTAPPKITSNQRTSTDLQMVMNQELGLLALRHAQKLLDAGTRDLDKECGYPDVLTVEHYRAMYAREMGFRVVSIYPDECWAVDPEVYENEKTNPTKFDLDWSELVSSQDRNPLHYCHRVDILSGIGSFGALLLGVNDKRELASPLEGVGPDPRPVGRPANRKLVFLRAFAQSLVKVLDRDENKSSPRYGQPLNYEFILGSPDSPGDGVFPSVGGKPTKVHWSRVIHVADNRESSEVEGVPRQQNVFNRLLDVRKVLGGSAEMFWKGGFPGYSFEMNPDLAGGVDFNEEKLRKQFYAYTEGLQRFIAVKGLVTKSMAPQVADPSHSLLAQLQAIALIIGVPLRIFMGSEQAQLASGQDVRTWNRRLLRRQNRYLSPMLLRPLVDRLIQIGVLTSPLAGPSAYKIFWPEINVPSEEEKSLIAERRTIALGRYITEGIYQIMSLKRYLITILGLTAEESSTIVEEMGGEEAVRNIKPPVVQQAEAKAKAAPEKTGGNSK